ncbi:MAG: hypothetical protein ACLTS6_14830 [Anaerobutyricum sp.]
MFIDEIHRLNRQVEEVLYPAMEDFSIDIMIGKGRFSEVNIRLELPHFYIGRSYHKSRNAYWHRLRDRFGVVNRLEFYTDEELRSNRRTLSRTSWCKD